MDHITIYTDGSSKGNPGPGGFGAILMFGKHSKEISMGYRFTTNNRMELIAVLASLEALKKNDLPLTIHSDSQYVVKAINEGWLNNWIKTGFKGGKKNKDLWVKYFQLSKKFKIKIQWVKGHADNPYNNRFVEFATTAAAGKHLLIDEGYENQVGN